MTRVLIAWANLYVSLRSVAPTLTDIKRATVEYEPTVLPAVDCSQTKRTPLVMFANMSEKVRALVRAPKTG